MANFTLTMKRYNAGFTLEEAVKRGADPVEFAALVEKYQDRPITIAESMGLPRQVGYTCDYHTGGAMGAKLRELAKQSQK